MKKRALLALLCLLPLYVWAADEDDFGTWMELGASKALPHNFSVGLEGELRMQDGSRQLDRLGMGLNVGYKPNKYLKLRASYVFLDAFSPEKRKEHYKEHDDGTLKLDDDGNAIWNGYKVTEDYWTPKHRFSIEATGSVKLWKWLRVSLRERFQFTHRMQVDANETKYRFDRSPNGDGTYEYVPKEGYPIDETDCKEAQDDPVLRSRLKLEVDKKRLAWSPFISIEAHQDFSDAMRLQKVRSSIGTEYRINRQHSVSLAYVLTWDLSEAQTERMHALSLGYGFDF